VLVGEYQAVGRNKRSGPASGALAQTRGGKPNVIEPFARRLEAVLLLPMLERRVIEGPHSFVGEPRGDEDQTECDDDNDGKLSHLGSKSVPRAVAKAFPKLINRGSDARYRSRY